MTKEQALNIIDQVLANFRGSREEHMKLQQAFNTIVELLEKKEKKNDKK